MWVYAIQQLELRQSTVYYSEGAMSLAEACPSQRLGGNHPGLPAYLLGNSEVYWQNICQRLK